MRKKLFKLYVFLFLAVIGVLALLTLLFALMQTKTMQGYIITNLISEAKKKGVTLKIEGVEGMAPFNWSLYAVEISTEEGEKLSMEKVKLKIAFLPLFQKKLSIKFFTVDKMIFAFTTSKQEILFTEIPSFSLPFDFSAKTLKIKELILEDLTANKTLLLCIEGKAKVNGSLQEMQLDLLVNEIQEDNTLQIELLSSKKRNLVSGDIGLKLFDSSTLSAFFELPIEASLKASISCSGKWSFWEAVETNSVGTPLSFSVSTNIKSLKVEELPFLNREWTFQSDFFLWPDLSSYAKNCSLESDWIRFLGRASLSSSFIPITGSAIITLKDLSEIGSALPYPLAGEVIIKTALSQTDFLFSAKCQELGIGEEKYSPAYWNVESSLVDNVWEGKSLLELKNDILPWKGSAEFSFHDQNFKIKDILIETESAKVSGAGYAGLHDYSWGGSFFILAEELRLFRKLFPSSDLEGSLGGNFSLKGREENLSLASNLLFKNVRYQSSLVDSIKIETNVKNALIQPAGFLSLECENLFVKGGELEKLYFNSSQTGDGNHTFSLEASGEWKEEFTLSSQGSWRKVNDNWSISVGNFEGLLFTKPFKVEPFTLGQNGTALSLENFSLTVGEGTFFLEGLIEKEKVHVNTIASHLPIDVFSLFYPTLTLDGKASFQGSFTGSKEETGGTFLATLEEVDFSQMKAKGSLQAHITPSSLQVHTHIYATEQQFLDWTGTFPLKYSYEPFRLFLDKKKPVSSEVTTQGAIEEIFDFLQSASEKTSGWVTSHLFLSGSLEDPFLLGETDLQGGRYENYITGTRLKGIEGSIQALGKTLTTDEFTAYDLDKGSIEGVGTLYLKPEEKFPFEIAATLKEMRLIRSEMLDTTASGKVVIEGNRTGAKARGDLNVNKALFSIADSLPMEVPTIPVKHLNKPIHLQRSEVIIPAVYPMNLELALSAEDSVLIKGKGLDSEWHGNLFVTGTPLSPIAKGSLTLKKGEFKFSGKTFTLMSGDLSFSDKLGQDAYLKLNGQLQLQGTMITATMQGPLRAPRLTFQSSPHLPTSSILSLILFNKDISEISPLQTIQLAQVIMSLSGTGGPDVLEAIRKSIGIDRLSISGKDGTEEIAVQVGWYLSHGITVSLSQSATSSDIKVEVDLKNGFIFEAETQNQEEGKFSLKWNKNY